MAVTENDVRNEIDGYMPGFSTGPEFPEIAAVALFLANGAANANFLQALRGLEDALQERIRQRLTPPAWQIWRDPPNMEQQIQNARGYWTARAAGGEKDAAFSHLLSEELTAVEAANGFDFHNAHHRKAQYYVSVITPEDFRSQLRLGRHWKDPGVPGAHGEYTHRIQWYLVCRANVLGPGRAVEIFKMLGFAGIPLAPPVNGATETDLWQLVCDRDRFNGGPGIAPKADSMLDFRCPEHFNQYLTTQISYAHYPVLRSFLNARRQKRAGGGYFAFDYIAQKAYNTDYASLPTQRKRQVLRVMGDKVTYSQLVYNDNYAALPPLQRQAVDQFFAARATPTGVLRL